MSDTLFAKTFQSEPRLSHFSPGRVNLIGEHTDYNGGFVLPTALQIGLDIAYKPRADDQINIISNGFKGMAKRRLGETTTGHWSDYVVGSLNFASNYGLNPLRGANIAISSTLPVGAGLSSSAALIVGLLKINRNLSASTLDDLKLAQIARQVENDYIGVPCGIMDQVAVAVATSGEAIKLDTNSLTYDIVPLPSSHKMAILHSGHYRQLNEGRYKERKEECDLIKEVMGREDICRASVADLQTLSHLPNTMQRRARHCVTEHKRTQKATQSLQGEDMQTFGHLMIESHISMQKDFEITIPAIDNLVEDAVKLGALGARMTGGGFGGCIVACVPKDNVQKWSQSLIAKHPKAFYVC